MIELSTSQAAPDLPPGVRLWQVDLDMHGEGADLEPADSAERERAGRMAFARDARRYLATRHALRTILGELLGVDPGQVALATDDVGKPCLEGHRLHFNVSHSDHLALIGVSDGHAIGVDIEKWRTIDGIESLARRQLTASEWEAWASIPAPERDAAFLSLWVCKEAGLKALGVGLAAEPGSIDVSTIARDPGVRVPLGAGACKVDVYPLRTDAGMAAAVALAEASSVILARRHFQSA